MERNGGGRPIVLASNKTTVSIGFTLAPQLAELARRHSRDLTGEVRHALRLYVQQHDSKETRHDV